MSRAIAEGGLVAAAVLSGNRNFEGRVNPDVRANYLASPPLVVAYALAGTTDIDLAQRAARHRQGRPTRAPGRDLADARPRSRRLEAPIGAEMFRSAYGNVFDGNPTWNAIAGAARATSSPSATDSTYIQEPPFFQGLTLEPRAARPTSSARASWPCSATR